MSLVPYCSNTMGPCFKTEERSRKSIIIELKAPNFLKSLWENLPDFRPPKGTRERRSTHECTHGTSEAVEFIGVSQDVVSPNSVCATRCSAGARDHANTGADLGAPKCYDAQRKALCINVLVRT